jgi:hypothetical protein
MVKRRRAEKAEQRKGITGTATRNYGNTYNKYSLRVIHPD